MELIQGVLQKFNLKFPNLNFTPSQMQAGSIILLLFLLVLALAQIRRHFIQWSLRGALFGLFFGFLIALIAEGFLVIGGRTALTEILGWENAPKPLVALIDSGRSKMANVLGVTDEIPRSVAKENPTVEEAINVLQSLDPTEIKKVKSLLCTP